MTTCSNCKLEIKGMVIAINGLYYCEACDNLPAEKEAKETKKKENSCKSQS